MPRDLLDELAALAREEQCPPGGDDRFDARMRGALNAEEEERLREEAGVSATGRVAYEASRPFGQGARDRFLAIAKRELGTGAEEAATKLSQEAPELGKSGATVVPMRRRGAARVFAAGGALLAAAALMLLLLRPATEPSLPLYQLEISGGEQPLRAAPSEDTAEPLLGPGSSVVLLLRPSTRANAGVSARGFVASETSYVARQLVTTQGVHLLDLHMEVSQEGAVRIDVPSELVLQHVEGRTAWLLVTVGTPGALPSTPSELATMDPSVQLFAQRIRLRAP